jgi:hypothetical protein
MAQQQAGAAVPEVPAQPENNNPSGGWPDHPATVDGDPVSPAVARPRQGAAAAQGHGPGGSGPSR